MDGETKSATEAKVIKWEQLITAKIRKMYEKYTQK